MKEIVIMRFILSVLMLLASMLASIGAVNYPARTNGNNTFYGSINALGRVTVGASGNTNSIGDDWSVINNLPITNGNIKIRNWIETPNTAWKIGFSAGQYASGNSYLAIGNSTALAATNIGASLFIGNNSGQNSVNAGSSIFIGTFSGQNATNSRESMFLGYNAGKYGNNLTNVLIIDHYSDIDSRGTNGLIYGEFDNRLLRVNGRLEATNGFLLRSNLVSTIPTLSPGDNFYWSSNGVPHVIWQDQAGTQATNRLVP